MDTGRTIETIFRYYSFGNGEENYLDEPGALDVNLPIWFHVDGLIDPLHEPFGEDLLDGCISWVLKIIDK